MQILQIIKQILTLEIMTMQIMKIRIKMIAMI